jgi:murein DD-endopeptidase MepM/ murein hydrolase activator NlpD
MKVLAVVAVGAVTAWAGVVVFLTILAPGLSGVGCAGGLTITGTQLDPAACQNAETIISTIEKAGLKGQQLNQAAVDAIAASLQETGGSLHNIPYGDRDSLGLFQQRPSAGWGTPAQVMDPVYATGQFLRHLVAIPGWEMLAVGKAAQAVQGSIDAAGDLYQRWAPEAQAIAQALLSAPVRVGTAVVDAFPGDPFGGACHPTVTQPWGPTTLQGEPVIGGVLFHTGIDLGGACGMGSPVVTLTDGTVYSAVTGCKIGQRACGGGWGNNVVVTVTAKLPGDLNPVPYFLRYAHLTDVSVIPGAVLQAGQQIGHEGMTGFATGPHVHFEVDRLRPVVQDTTDPTSWLRLG